MEFQEGSWEKSIVDDHDYDGGPSSFCTDVKVQTTVMITDPALHGILRDRGNRCNTWQPSCPSKKTLRSVDCFPKQTFALKACPFFCSACLLILQRFDWA